MDYKQEEEPNPAGILNGGNKNKEEDRMDILWIIVGCCVLGLAIYGVIKHLIIWTPECGMNKIQLIILWCMGIIFSVIAISIGIDMGPNPYYWDVIIGLGLPVLIIGSLLIYTFRKK